MKAGQISLIQALKTELTLHFKLHGLDVLSPWPTHDEADCHTLRSFPSTPPMTRVALPDHMSPLDTFIGSEDSDQNAHWFQLVEATEGVGGEQWGGVRVVRPGGMLRSQRGENEVGGGCGGE